MKMDATVVTKRTIDPGALAAHRAGCVGVAVFAATLPPFQPAMGHPRPGQPAMPANSSSASTPLPSARILARIGATFPAVVRVAR